MKKNLTFVTLALIMITLTACGTVAQAASSNPPIAIQDPLLLEAWTHLDSHAESVKLWDGRAISGHELAQYILVNAIPVKWDTESVC